MKTRLAPIAALVLSTAASAQTVTQRIPGPDGGWDYASVDAEGRRLFVSRTDGVMVVDLATGNVTPKFVPGAKVHASFIIPGSGLGLSTNGTTNSVSLFDARTGAVKAEVPVGKKPDAAIYDASARLAYVMNADDGSVSLLDPFTAKVVGTIPVGGALEFATIDGKGHLFVNVEDKSEIAEIDLAARKVVRRTALKGCDEPSGLAYTKSGALIAACANGVAKTLDAASGAMLPDIAIGPRPDAVVYDAARDRAYIPSGGNGTLTVIDTSSHPRAIGTVTTQTGARTGAVDPATGIVYLPAARYPEGATGRPKPVPGSFEVLVVAGAKS